MSPKAVITVFLALALVIPGVTLLAEPAAAEAVTFGTSKTFSEDGAEDIQIAALDATHFVVAYRDSTDSNSGKVVVGIVNEGSVAFGGTVKFYSSEISLLSVAALDATHFVVAFQETQSGFGNSVVGTVSGTTITLGSKYVFNSAVTGGISVAALDATHFVVTYRDGGNAGSGTALIGTVSGTSITHGPEAVINSSPTNYTSVAALDATHFVVTYREDSLDHRVIACSVSGTSITYGPEVVIGQGGRPTTIAALDATHFVIAYTSASPSLHGTVIVGSVSGTTITLGPQAVYNAAFTWTSNVAALDATHFILSYSTGGTYFGDTTSGNALIGTVSGTSINLCAPSVSNSGSSSYYPVAALDATHFVVAYKSLASVPYYGAVKLGTAMIPPVASFTASSTIGQAPLEVMFTDTSANSPTSWAWNFGDGQTSTVQNPAHTYTDPGTYTVTLEASNTEGSSTATKTVTVTAAPPPDASFTASSTIGQAPLEVMFTDTSANSPTSWAWNFGDGQTSTVQNPAHTYTDPGTYTVTLTVQNTVGSATETKTNYIAVGQIPEVTSTPIVSATEGYLYEYQLTANQGIDTWTKVSGPSFLTLSSSGLLSGTPSASDVGSRSVSIKAISAFGTAYQNFSLAIAAIPDIDDPTWPPSFNTLPVTSGKVGMLYQYAIETNETANLILSSSPSWLKLTGSVLSGTPTQAGAYSVSLKATSSAGLLTAWQNWTITVTTISADPGDDDDDKPTPTKPGGSSGEDQIITEDVSGNGNAWLVVIVLMTATIVVAGIAMAGGSKKSGRRRR